jgi:cytochrome c oxidase subunit IV
VLIVLGVVFGYWLSILGFGAGATALMGWVFEYYRGDHAH